MPLSKSEFMVITNLLSIIRQHLSDFQTNLSEMLVLNIRSFIFPLHSTANEY